MAGGQIYLPKQLRVCVVLISVDLMGREVTAPADTALVGAYGCIVSLKRALPFSGEVEVCWNENRAKGFLRSCKNWRDVLHLETSEAPSQQYAIEFQQTLPQFWEIELPVTTTNEPMQLECCNCEFTLPAELDNIERMVCMAEGTVMRLCPCCGEARYFRTPRPKNIPVAGVHDLNLVTTGEEIYHLKTRAERIKEHDERRHKRMLTRNTRACVQRPGRRDDLVDVLDISLGGLRFQSSQEYNKGELIQVATHYIEGGNNIFQSAQIVRLQARPRGAYPGEYGAQYIHNGQ
jgi:hypothetical protein